MRNARGLVAGAVAGVVLVAWIVLSRAPTDTPAAPPPQDPPRAPAEPRARPPEFPPVTSDADLVAHWAHVLEAGDEDGVDWAVSRLRRIGPTGRRAVRDAARAAVGANDALVGQGLSFLSAAPEPEDAEFALAALSSSDSQAVLLAAKLVGDAPGPDRDAAARALGRAARNSTRAVRYAAIESLAKIGGDVAAREAVDLATSAPADEAPGAWAALGKFRHEVVRAALAETWKDPREQFRFAAAGALVDVGDVGPVPWLHEQTARKRVGGVDYAGAALGILSRIKDPVALAKIGAVVSDVRADPRDRLAMVDLLAPYPFEEKRAFLDAAAADLPGADDDVRAAALEGLLRAGAPGASERLQRMAREGDRRAAFLAAIVLGRFRTPEASDALVAATRRKDLDDEARTMCLRALVISGSPATAEVVVRAMTDDRGPYSERVSVAYNVAEMLSLATPEFRAAAGAAIVRALEGAFGGEPSGAGLLQLLRAAAGCCGEEAAPAVTKYLGHADAPVRATAAVVLSHVAGPAAETDLKAAWWRWSDEETRRATAGALERAHFRLGAAGGRIK